MDRDITVVEQNLHDAQQKLKDANSAVEKMRALAEIVKYEYILATAD